MSKRTLFSFRDKITGNPRGACIVEVDEIEQTMDVLSAIPGCPGQDEPMAVGWEILNKDSKISLTPNVWYTPQEINELGYGDIFNESLMSMLRSLMGAEEEDDDASDD